jgi:uncharacterized iron-regulated membrane protein
MKRNRTFRYWIGQVHLWLGLASGLVVFIVSITGCIFVFQKEISDITYKKTFFIQPQQTATLPVGELKQKAQAALGQEHVIGNIIVFKEKKRAWEFMLYKSNSKAVTYFGAMEHFRSVFINPYTGAVTGFRDYKYDFFTIVKWIHWSLLLNTSYGQPIVGWSTFIFVVSLITGLVLWWPKKASSKRSFAIRWKARFKKLNYDLHSVLGFYSLLLALLMGLTGMLWSFQWFQSAVYATAAGTTQKPAYFSAMSDTAAVAIKDPMEMAYRNTVQQLPSAERINLSPAYGKKGALFVFAYGGKETYYDHTSLQFDQYTGKLLYRRDAASKNPGERLIDMNFDIHVGAIAGIPGKIIAFIISLVCASLPVTGFCIWRNKKAKGVRWKA